MSRSVHRKLKRMMSSAPRDTSWDKSGCSRPCFFVGGKEVTETEYRIFLHGEGHTDHEIETIFKMIRGLNLGEFD